MNDATKPSRPDCGHSVCLWPADPCGWCEQDKRAEDVASLDAKLASEQTYAAQLEAALLKMHREFCCSPQQDERYGFTGECLELQALFHGRAPLPMGLPSEGAAR